MDLSFNYKKSTSQSAIATATFSQEEAPAVATSDVSKLIEKTLNAKLKTWGIQARVSDLKVTGCTLTLSAIDSQKNVDLIGTTGAIIRSLMDVDVLPAARKKFGSLKAKLEQEAWDKVQKKLR